MWQHGQWKLDFFKHRYINRLSLNWTCIGNNFGWKFGHRRSTWWSQSWGRSLLLPLCWPPFISNWWEDPSWGMWPNCFDYHLIFVLRKISELPSGRRVAKTRRYVWLCDWTILRTLRFVIVGVQAMSRFGRVKGLRLVRHIGEFSVLWVPLFRIPLIYSFVKFFCILTKNGRHCMQNNRLLTSSHVEVEDNSIVFDLLHLVNFFVLWLSTLNLSSNGGFSWLCICGVWDWEGDASGVWGEFTLKSECNLCGQSSIESQLKPYTLRPLECNENCIWILLMDINNLQKHLGVIDENNMSLFTGVWCIDEKKRSFYPFTGV